MVLANRFILAVGMSALLAACSNSGSSGAKKDDAKTDTPVTKTAIVRPTSNIDELTLDWNHYKGLRSNGDLAVSPDQKQMMLPSWVNLQVNNKHEYCTYRVVVPFQILADQSLELNIGAAQIFFFVSSMDKERQPATDQCYSLVSQEEVLSGLLKGPFFEISPFNTGKIRLFSSDLILFGEDADGGAGEETNIFISWKVDEVDMTSLFQKWYSGTYLGEESAAKLIVDEAGQRVTLGIGPSVVSDQDPVCNATLQPARLSRVSATGIDIVIWLANVSAADQKCYRQRLGTSVTVSAAGEVGIPIFLFSKNEIQLSLIDQYITLKQK